jgi:hypothetical protein
MPIFNEFVSTHDPSHIMEFTQFFSEPSNLHGIVTVPLQHLVLISRFENPCCFSSKLIGSSLIIDSGASVCISSHKSDFITYNKSNMKIKNLSSSNHVAGEGIIQWSMHDALGTLIQIELLGYHIPKADVWLLSPQVLITTIGGQLLRTDIGIDITLNNIINLFAQYCPQSNLPQSLLCSTLNHQIAFGTLPLALLPIISRKSMQSIPHYVDSTLTYPIPRRNFYCGTNNFAMPQSLGFS